MAETLKKAIPELEMEAGFKRFFEEHRAYHKAWATEWAKKIESNCSFNADCDSAAESFQSHNLKRGSEDVSFS